MQKNCIVVYCVEYTEKSKTPYGNTLSIIISFSFRFRGLVCFSFFKCLFILTFF